MNKYGPKAQAKIGKVMHEYKHGELTQGPKGPKVKSARQAKKIGIEEARREGDKVPKQKD